MSLFKKLLTAIVLMSLGFTTQAHSFEIDAETKSVANRIIQNVFSDIDSQKKEFKDLKLFSRLALKTNKYGINEIEYYFKDPKRPKSKSFLEFFVTILPEEETTAYDEKEEYFTKHFPVLGLKVVAYQNVTKRSRQVNVFPSVKKRMRQFYNYQSKFLPLQFVLIPKKDIFQIGEPIEFTAIITSRAPLSQLIKEPSTKSIAFEYDEVQWGADMKRGAGDAKTIPLRPGGSTSTAFSIKGFTEAREVEIYARYLVAVEDVMPTASFKITITP